MDYGNAGRPMGMGMNIDLASAVRASAKGAAVLQVAYSAAALVRNLDQGMAWFTFGLSLLILYIVWMYDLGAVIYGWLMILEMIFVGLNTRLHRMK